MNIGWSRDLLRQFYQEGVRDIVFCAGARNSPFVAVLEKANGFQTHSFFEERSAAFFALGCARRTGCPVAVITTSGTAAAELLPASVEAFHTGVPLILVTADRPRRLRGTGAPQAIDQTGLFAKFVSLEFDLEQGETFSLAGWNRRAPVHLNICFDEPLIDEPVEPLTLTSMPTPVSFLGRSSFAVSAGSEWAALRLARFLKVGGPLLVMVGTLETEEERAAVASLCLRLNAPVYLESTSGLRERADLQGLALRSGDRVLNWGLRKNLFWRTLRIGGVPTARIWRDLENPASTIEVFSLTAIPFAGLSRGEMVCAEIGPSLTLVSRDLELRGGVLHAGDEATRLLDKDREAEAELLRLYQEEPTAEPALVRALSRAVPEGARVYLGNSLPIREWDLAAAHDRAFVVQANRGVNGIDGQISTFLGLCGNGVAKGDENWAIIGDLTALYDLAAPWAITHCPEAVIRLVIINNGGGRIFSRLFQSPLFENRHGIGFEAWARMWNLGYHRWTSVPEDFVGDTTEVIEVVPDEAATQRFWDRYDRTFA